MSFPSLIPNWRSGTIILIYLVAFLWWITMLITGTKDSFANNSYGLILGLIPVVGGIQGFFIAKQWGGWQSAVGKAIWFLSLGLVSWGLGTWIFSGYYNLYTDIEVPYPSLADVGYVLSLPFWALGMINLSKSTGAKFGLRARSGKSMLLVVPIAAIILSYYLLVVVARGGGFDFSESGIMKIFFDLLYPIGDVVILTIATLVYGLSYQYFGGQYKKAIYILLGGFIVMYAADFAFSYTTTLETFYVGDWVDFLFTSSMFVLSYALTLFDYRRLSVPN